MSEETKEVATFEDPEQYLEKLNGKFELLKRVRDMAIKHTRAADWIDESGKPYLVESGAVEIAKAFNVKIYDQEMSPPEIIKHEGEPDEMIFTITGKIFIPNLGEFVGMGACSTRDKLLGTKDGKPKLLKDVNLPSVQKKAHTNFVGNIIKHSLGLANRTWLELEELGIKQGDVTKVSYAGHGQKKELSDKAKEKLEKIRDMAAYCFQDDAKAAKQWYIETTEFDIKDGDGEIIDHAKGKQDPNKFTEKQIMKIVYPRLKEMYEKMKQAEVDGAADRKLFT